MPRLIHRNPAYQLHRASGQAVVCLSGVDVYLGPYDSEASRREYNRVVGEWVANDRRAPAAPGAAGGIFVAELAAAYAQHADAYYARSKGERGAIGSMLAVVLATYADARAAGFGPLALQAVRRDMVGRGWNRNYVNQQVVRLRQMFRWGVSQELVPESAYAALRTVQGLGRGRTAAPEPEPVRPVDDAHVEATLPHLPNDRLRAMVNLQRLTGMRPGELCAMRTCDVDTTTTDPATGQPVWTYRPVAHKTEHHGHDRVVYLGPKAQNELRPWLRPDTAAYVFQPAEGEVQRLAARHAARKTPGAHGNAPGTNRRRRPKVRPGDCYTVDSYRRAITRACELAFGMPGALRKATKDEAPDAKAARLAAAAAWRARHCWHPHQLRHTAGTNIRRDFGLEAAQVILGHTTLTATQVYAERNVGAARRIMGEVG